MQKRITIENQTFWTKQCKELIFLHSFTKLGNKKTIAKLGAVERRSEVVQS